MIKCLLDVFSLVWTLMSTKLWGLSCFLIRNMFGLLVVYLTHLILHMHFQCFGHALHIAHTYTTLVMHWFISCLFILTCHVYLMLCSTLFCFRFELHFLIHLTPLMHRYHYSYFHLLPSFLLNFLSIPKKKGENILSRVYWSVLSFIYDFYAHL